MAKKAAKTTLTEVQAYDNLKVMFMEIEKKNLLDAYMKRILTRIGLPSANVGSKKYETQIGDAVKVLEVLLDYEYIKDQNGIIHAIVGNRLLPARGESFKNHVAARFEDIFKKPPAESNINNALNVIEGRKDMPSKWIDVRVNAEGMDDLTKAAIYYDLCNPEGEAVKITKDGYEIVKRPLLFRESDHLLPQVKPVPVEKANIKKILDHLSVNAYIGEPPEMDNAVDGSIAVQEHKAQSIEDAKFALMVETGFAFIPSTYERPIPKISLCLTGVFKCGKTTTAKKIKRIVDPARNEVIEDVPRKRDSFKVQMLNNYLVVYDNVSEIPAEIMDLICATITGGGFIDRKLYTDAEIVTYNLRRGIHMTGIANILTRADLIDRYVSIDLLGMKDEERRSEEEIFSKLGKDMPIILAGIFKTISTAMKNYDQCNITAVSRSLDHDKWCYCIAEAIEPDGGGKRYLEILRKLEAEKDRMVSETNLLAQAIESYMEGEHLESVTTGDGDSKKVERIKVPNEMNNMRLSEARSVLYGELANVLRVPERVLAIKYPSMNSEFRRELLNIKNSMLHDGYAIKLKKDQDRYLLTITKAATNKI